LRTPDAPEPADPGLVAAERGVLWLRYRAPDVQAALDVLTRRTPADDEPPIFLSHTDLQNARMSGGTWRRLICRHSGLRRPQPPEHAGARDAQGGDLSRMTATPASSGASELSVASTTRIAQ
jgi:hypothetical protein